MAKERGEEGDVGFDALFGVSFSPTGEAQRHTLILNSTSDLICFLRAISYVEPWHDSLVSMPEEGSQLGDL